MVSSTITLSVIIPVYNEARRLQNLEKIASYLKKLPYTTELIVVNDGSTDTTNELLVASKVRNAHAVITYSPNKGKGYAIKTGMQAARGRYRLFMDVDLSVPLSEIPRFMRHTAGADILIATRKTNASKVIKHQPPLRELMGRLFTWLSKTLLALPVSDFTCGFKLFSSKAAIAIFSKARINRWGFDSEVLCIAHTMGYTVKEMSVTWRNDPHTQVKFPQDILRSLAELCVVVYNAHTGKYA